MSDDFYSIRRLFDESILEHRAKVEVFIEQYIQRSLPMASYSQYSKTRVESMLRELSNQLMEITRESVHKMQIKASKKMGTAISGAQSTTLTRVNELEEETSQLRLENEKLSSQVRTMEARLQEKDTKIDEYIRKFKEVERLLHAVAEKDYESVIAGLEENITQLQQQYTALQEKHQTEKEQWELKFLDQAKKLKDLKNEENEEN
ncbi:MAG: hypothetical protein ACFFBD_09485 [Candidatus Hodarchaeota archaeon]